MIMDFIRDQRAGLLVGGALGLIIGACGMAALVAGSGITLLGG